MIRLLVVEDNSDLLQELKWRLSQAGMSVWAVSSGKAMQAALQQTRVDIVILDIGLPDVDGLQLAASLKSSDPGLGVIMLTADLRQDVRLESFALGADHYLTKPVYFPELIAVVQALYRRLGVQQPSMATGHLVLSVRQMQIWHSDHPDVVMALTWHELQLLTCFARSAQQEASKIELVQALGENPQGYDMRRLETAISRLRKKLAPLDAEEQGVIKALRNQGYHFMQPLCID